MTYLQRIEWDGSLSWFSNYGTRKVEMCAPGAAIYTTAVGGGYTCEWGTSFSAPYVAGVAALATSKDNVADIKKQMTIQTIGHDKINQLRHVRYFKNVAGLKEHMKKHAEFMRPKFEATLKVLEDELTGLGIGTWSEPRGGYFISFDAMEGCAKAIVAKCKEAGVILTNAGATFPYGKDPKDSNIRIAPSFPTPEEMSEAAELFVLCTKLVSVEKLLEQK